MYIYIVIGSPKQHLRVKIMSRRFEARPHWSLESGSRGPRDSYILCVFASNITVFIHITAVRAVIQKGH